MKLPVPRTLGYVAAWAGAATAAVGVGLFAVTGVSADVRDRGPAAASEADAVRQALASQEGVARPDADAPRVADSFGGVFGDLDVSCQGAVAFGDGARPAPGWRVVSFEEGPDDDVDAIFSSGDRSVELEVYCDAGVAVVSDRELKTLPDEVGR